MGKGGNLYTDAGYKLNGSAYVIEKYLGNTWLWDRVRVVGGAYGGFCSFDPQSGGFNFLSYRWGCVSVECCPAGWAPPGICGSHGRCPSDLICCPLTSLLIPQP